MKNNEDICNEFFWVFLMVYIYFDIEVDQILKVYRTQYMEYFWSISIGFLSQKRFYFPHLYSGTYSVQ
jgi:hypothetical protein